MIGRRSGVVYPMVYGVGWTMLVRRCDIGGRAKLALLCP
jgi:hypothetical protein